MAYWLYRSWSALLASSPVVDARAGPACFSTTADGLVNFPRRQLDKKEDMINEIAELVMVGSRPMKLPT
jgi:hypothetical protein